jgi:hypothetical protein
MADEVDILQIKIEKAKGELTEETRKAIDAVDWKAAILGMRESKGYSFEQLGDLETETELLLCGLINPEDYPKELEIRMRIPKSKAQELVDEMNMLVFSKIREEMVKNNEREKIFANKKEGAPIVPRIITPATKPDLTLPELAPALPNNATANLAGGGRIPSILTQKFTDSFKMNTVKTEHTPQSAAPTPPPKVYPKGADPYRVIPE